MRQSANVSLGNVECDQFVARAGDDRVAASDAHVSKVGAHKFFPLLGADQLRNLLKIGVSGRDAPTRLNVVEAGMDSGLEAN